MGGQQTDRRPWRQALSAALTSQTQVQAADSEARQLADGHSAEEVAPQGLGDLGRRKPSPRQTHFLGPEPVSPQHPPHPSLQAHQVQGPGPPSIRALCLG